HGTRAGNRETRRPLVTPTTQTASTAHAWVWSADSTRPLRLKLRDVEPPRAAFTVQCSGAGCPARLHRGQRAPGHDLLKLLRGAQLAAGAEVEIRGTAPRRIGRTARFRYLPLITRRDRTDQGTSPTPNVQRDRVGHHPSARCPSRGAARAPRSRTP